MRRAFVFLCIAACSAGAGTTTPSPSLKGHGGGPGSETLISAVLAQNEGTPSRIRISNGFAYWATRDRFGHTTIRRNYDNGRQGLPETVTIDASVFDVDGDTVYYATATNEIRSVPGAGGNSTSLTQVSSSVSDLLARNGVVFWSSEQTITRIATTGGAPQILGSALPTPTSLATDGTNVDWTEKAPAATGGGGLNWLPIGGGAPASLDPNMISRSLVIVNGRAAWIDSTPAIKTKLLSGGEETTIPVAESVTVLALDDASIFYAAGSVIQRVSFAGGSPTPIAQASAVALAVDDTSLYAATADGSIMKFAKDGSAASEPPFVPSAPDESCPAPTVGTADELAQTPRANTDLERLALSLDPTQLTAPQATYDRVVRDVTAIRAAHPSLQPATGGYGTEVPDPTKFEIETDRDARDGGAQPDWGCLDSFYGITPQDPSFVSGAGTSWELSARGVLRTSLLFPLYEKVPLITNVQAAYVGSIPEHVPAQICARISATTWDYEFDTGGDFFVQPPPAPRIISWFSTDASGAIVTSGAWSSDQDAAMPPWRCSEQ